ncbi:MAG: hypothetical protein NAG76_18580 [Candidatus Pristimantibacillus lignocellulolyticus]|uniref:Uncharacterized protein n=1 Tax=Candidatus Pristimantibacillus lignocellulolyticus TaxID=2994561 RepID=A0A9J6ZCA4_9BACL|nr:MAG: hypothetical protein NAG76_18580 [Candidatus Pristimantibacillus lignocellulolyticus]
MKCEKCDSINVIEGKLTTGFAGVVFTTITSFKKMPFTKNYSLILANACKDCGHIFSLKLVTPDSVNQNK